MTLRRLLICAVSAALASTLAASARRLPVRVFTVADGLPQNEIHCIEEDSRGFLWLGTSEGLARFDGREFVTYGREEGLPHPGVQDVLEAPDGALWLATGAGVVRFDVGRSGSLSDALRTYRLGDDPGSPSRRSRTRPPSRRAREEEME